jgi:hypothetical protein
VGKMDEITNTLKTAFSEMIKKDMLWGIKPVFNGDVDLEVKDSKMKTLILTYLQYSEDVYPHPFKISYSWEEEIGEDEYPVRLPILCRTFFDHWNENKKILQETMFVKFINFGKASRWDTKSSLKRRYKRQMDKIRKELEEKGYDLSKILFIPLYGKIEENIGEFISLFYFRKLGYLTTVLVPFTGIRAPDVTCWRTPLLRKLREFGLMDNGATLYELSMLRVFGKIKDEVRDNACVDESITIEVESDRPSAGVVQLLGHLLYEKGPYPSNVKEGYVEGGNYDKGFIVAPFYKHEDRVGVLTFDENGMFYKDCPKSFSIQQNKEKSIKEIDNLVKWVLLTNLTFNEILELLADIKSKTFFQILNEVNKIKEERIIEEVKNVMKK